MNASGVMPRCAAKRHRHAGYSACRGPGLHAFQCAPRYEADSDWQHEVWRDVYSSVQPSDLKAQDLGDVVILTGSARIKVRENRWISACASPTPMQSETAVGRWLFGSPRGYPTNQPRYRNLLW
jgi:hypothetical protein